MIVVCLQASSTAQHVKCSNLRQNELIGTSTSEYLLSITTVIPDAFQDVVDCVSSFDRNLNLQVMKMPTWYSPSLDILITGSFLQVELSKRLVRGLYPFTLMGVEFGGNYNVFVSIDSQTRPDVIQALRQVFSKYYHNYYSDQLS